MAPLVQLLRRQERVAARKSAWRGPRIADQVLHALGSSLHRRPLQADLLPAILARQSAASRLFTLTDGAERDDDCAKIYHKSLLYLVSHAFEAVPHVPLLSPGTPILGMDKWLRELGDMKSKKRDAAFAEMLGRIDVIRTPNTESPAMGRGSTASHHIDFDNDGPTVKSALAGSSERRPSQRTRSPARSCPSCKRRAAAAIEERHSIRSWVDGTPASSPAERAASRRRSRAAVWRRDAARSAGGTPAFHRYHPRHAPSSCRSDSPCRRLRVADFAAGDDAFQDPADQRRLQDRGARRGAARRAGARAHAAQAARVRRHAGARDARRRCAVSVGDEQVPRGEADRRRDESARRRRRRSSILRCIVGLGNHELDKSDDTILLARLNESQFRWVATNTRLLQERHGVRAVRERQRAGRGDASIDVGTPRRHHRPALSAGEAVRARRRDVIAAARDAVCGAGATAHRRRHRHHASGHARRRHARCRQLPGIDVVIGGHDHLFTQQQVGCTWITKADADAKSAIVYDITVERESGADDAAAGRARRDHAERSRRRRARAAMDDRAVARSSAATRPSATRRICSKASSPPCADARPRSAICSPTSRASRWAPTSRILNGGSIRINDNIPPGPITNYDMEGIFYYTNTLVALPVTGQQLLDMLRNSVSRADAGDGRFLQVSGLRFTYRKRDGGVRRRSRGRPGRRQAARPERDLQRGHHRLRLLCTAPRTATRSSPTPTRPPKINTEREMDFRTAVEEYIRRQGDGDAVRRRTDRPRDESRPPHCLALSAPPDRSAGLGRRYGVVLGLVIGVMALVISMALMTGYRRDLQTKLLGGNAEVFVYSIGAPIADPRQLLEVIRGTPASPTARRCSSRAASSRRRRTRPARK